MFLNIDYLNHLMIFEDYLIYPKLIHLHENFHSQTNINLTCGDLFTVSGEIGFCSSVDTGLQEKFYLLKIN